MENKSKDKAEIIETKELPIVSFCAYCEKPIYVGDEYVNVKFFDDVRKKSINKKHMISGYAHKHCALEKECEVEVLREKSRISHQYVLAFSIVAGFLYALALMLILLLGVKPHLAISIIVPWVTGYAITSGIYVLSDDKKFSKLYQKIGIYLLKLPITIWNSSYNELKWYIVLKVLMLIVLVPLAYVSLIVITLLSMIISMIIFPISLIKKD